MCILKKLRDWTSYCENSLIETYVKLGNIIYSRTIFDGMSSKDISTWNSLSGGYDLHVHADTALDLFDQMKKFGVRPKGGSFTNIFFAYSLAGMVEEGRKYFSNMTEEYQIMSGLEHYSATIEFIEDMPIEPDSFTGAALLTACRIHGNIGLAVRAGENMLDLEQSTREHVNLFFLFKFYSQV